MFCYLNFSGYIFQPPHLSSISFVICNKTNICSCCCCLLGILFSQSCKDSLDAWTENLFHIMLFPLIWGELLCLLCIQQQHLKILLLCWCSFSFLVFWFSQFRLTHSFITNILWIVHVNCICVYVYINIYWSTLSSNGRYKKKGQSLNSLVEETQRDTMKWFLPQKTFILDLGISLVCIYFVGINHGF